MVGASDNVEVMESEGGEDGTFVNGDVIGFKTTTTIGQGFSQGINVDFGTQGQVVVRYGPLSLSDGTRVYPVLIVTCKAQDTLVTQKTLPIVRRNRILDSMFSQLRSIIHLFYSWLFANICGFILLLGDMQRHVLSF